MCKTLEVKKLKLSEKLEVQKSEVQLDKAPF